MPLVGFIIFGFILLLCLIILNLYIGSLLLFFVFAVQDFGWASPNPIKHAARRRDETFQSAGRRALISKVE